MKKVILLSLVMGLASSHLCAEGVEGLPPGVQAPNFRLPVVNELASKDYGKWFGPAKWVGSNAKEPKKLVMMSFFATYCVPCKKCLS